jgi:hypothetical protein
MEKYRIMKEKSVKQILTVLSILLKVYFVHVDYDISTKNSIG